MNSSLKRSSEFAQKAQRLAEQGKLPEARQLCERACRQAPDVSQTWALLGAIDGRLGRFIDAAENYLRAINLEPTLISAHSGRVSALLAGGIFQEAHAACRQALQADPKAPVLHCLHGQLLERTDNVEEAITSYQRALDLKPNYRESTLRLGALLVQSGQWHQAAGFYKQALQFQPADPQLQVGLAS
ncbi:MAG: tetratricopeptide repeat protein, partial [Gammaproteobacteria bacterium]